MLLTTSEPWPTPSLLLQLVKVLIAQSVRLFVTHSYSLLWWKVPFKLGVVEKMGCPLSCFVKDIIISLEGPGHQHFSFLAKFYITRGHCWLSINWTELNCWLKKKNTQTKHWKFCFIQQTRGFKPRRQSRGGARIYSSFCKTKQTNKNPGSQTHQKII